MTLGVFPLRKILLWIAFSAIVLGLGTVLASASPQTSPQSCGACHEREYEEWGRSAHAIASRSETFTALVKSAPQAGSGWGEQPCLLCHAPLASANGTSDGVSCEACHFVESVGGIGNGDFTLSTDGVVRGPIGRQAPHPTVASDLMTDSLFCAACHEQYQPVTGVLLQGTYSEWLDSPAASEGIGCQDCHMQSPDGVSHEFAASARSPEAKAAALGQAISMSVQAPESLRAGDYAVLQVTLENVGAGHSLPTGKAEGYEMWLEVTIEAADGRVLHHERLSYGVVYENSDGEHDVPVTLWDAAGIFADHRLAPDRAVVERFPFAVPMDVQCSARIEARLMYGSRPSWLSEALGLPDVEAMPVHADSAAIEILAPRPSPTYIAPTPEPTPVQVPTSTGGAGETEVRAEGRGWVAPFLIAGAGLLILVGAWALHRRAV